MIRVVAKSTFKDGEVKKAIELYKTLTAESRKEDGCISYELHADIKNENILVVLEEWESEVHLDAHKVSPHMKAISPQMNEIRISLEVILLENLNL